MVIIILRLICIFDENCCIRGGLENLVQSLEISDDEYSRSTCGLCQIDCDSVGEAAQTNLFPWSTEQGE